MERKRPKATTVSPPELAVLDGGRPDTDEPLLTRAEARALRRTASLTHADLQRHLEGILQPPARSA